MVLFDAKNIEYLEKNLRTAMKPGGRLGFTTIRDMTRYARDASATQYENSYDDFLSDPLSVGLYVLRLIRKKLLKDVDLEIVFSVEEEREYLLPNYEA